jgi:ubiquinone/menaquinone biosynthesis C-methylase UbiE
MEGSRDHDAVRRSYDAVAEQYVVGFRDELGYKPLDRALLACLIEQSDQDAPIADLGCGPGHVAGWLASHGATAVGIDLSAGMIAVGRREYSRVEFRPGDLLALPAGDGEFGPPLPCTRSSTCSPANCIVPSRRSTGCCGLAG